jgi:DNA-binding MarR family transcriptional regulator
VQTVEEERATRPRGLEVSSPAEEVRAGLVALGVEMGNLTGRFAATTGLHPTDVRALWVLAEHDAPRTTGELGARLDLSSGAATRTVDRLERAGYVERIRDSDDRRRVCLCLTGEAQAVTSAFFGRVASVVGEAIEDFAESDLAIAARFLSRIHEALLESQHQTT